jgi:hypothetical protein
MHIVSSYRPLQELNNLESSSSASIALQALSITCCDALALEVDRLFESCQTFMSIGRLQERVRVIEALGAAIVLLKYDTMISVSLKYISSCAFSPSS